MTNSFCSTWFIDIACLYPIILLIAYCRFQNPIIYRINQRQYAVTIFWRVVIGLRQYNEDRLGWEINYFYGPVPNMLTMFVQYPVKFYLLETNIWFCWNKLSYLFFFLEIYTTLSSICLLYKVVIFISASFF